MELKMISGCICDSLTADNVEEVNMTDEQRLDTINHICAWMKENPNKLNYIMQALIPHFGEYESDDTPCECCGDYVETYTWKL